MYSRFQERPSAPLRLPENYSGCAFSEQPSPKATEPSIEAPTADAAVSPAPPPTPSPPSPLRHSLPISAENRSDELLLLGMMLLLFRGEEGEGLLPLLALLLFYP